MKYKHLLAAAALLTLSALPYAAHADVITGYTNSSVDLMAGPNGEFPPVAHISSGAPVHIIGCVNGFTWCDVESNGERGWVDAHFLDSDYNNRHVSVVEYGHQEKLPVVVFEQKSYWDTYYRNRPFYTERRYWTTP